MCSKPNTHLSICSYQVYACFVCFHISSHTHPQTGLNLIQILDFRSNGFDDCSHFGLAPSPASSLPLSITCNWWRWRGDLTVHTYGTVSTNVGCQLHANRAQSADSEFLILHHLRSTVRLPQQNDGILPMEKPIEGYRLRFYFCKKQLQ